MLSEQDQLRALEEQRCAAIGDGRIDDLKALLSPDYVHIHMTGKVDDRDGHLDAVRARPRHAERGKIDIRIYGDFAIMIGEQINVSRQPDGSSSRVAAVCQQVVVRTGGAWHFISCQLTRKQ